MKDSLAITAQAIPFLNDFKNFTYLYININYRKDNNKKKKKKKKRTHFPVNPFAGVNDNIIINLKNEMMIFKNVKNLQSLSQGFYAFLQFLLLLDEAELNRKVA